MPLHCSFVCIYLPVLARVADAISNGFNFGLCCTERTSGAAFGHFVWLEDLL